MMGCWSFHEYWTIILNPNNCEVTVQIDYLGLKSKTEVIPPHSRISVALTGEDIEASGLNLNTETYGGVAIILKCTTPEKYISAEQSIYWNSRTTGINSTGAFSD